MKAGLYVRVSTSQQVDRESLNFQEQRLRQYCKAQGHSIFKVYREEGVSAKDTNRPKLNELMRDIEAGKIHIVYVTKLDRITRSLKDSIALLEFFQKHSVTFSSITQNIDTTGSMGRFVHSIISAIAQVEREMTAERVTEHMHHRALSGKYNGGPVTFGFVTRERIVNELKKTGKKEEAAVHAASKLCAEAGKLYIDAKEAEIVKKIYEYYLKFNSIRKVTHLLNKEGITPRKSGNWATPSIARVLTNPTYIGKIWYGKRQTDIVTGKLKRVNRDKWKIVAGEHKGIISEKTFSAVQKVLKQKFTKPSRAERTHLLKGLLKCGICKGSMFGYTYHKKAGHGKRIPYNYYRCQNAVQKGSSVCKGMNVRGQDLEKAVEQIVLQLSENGKFLSDRKKMMNAYFAELGTAKPDAEDTKKKLLIEEKKLEDRKATLLEKLENKIIDDADFVERYEIIKKELESLHDRMADMASKGEDMDSKKLALQVSFDELSNLRKTWPVLDEEGRRLKLQAIIDRILVHEIKENKLRLTVSIFLDSFNAKKSSGLLKYCLAGLSVRLLYGP